ncbi:MAG: flavin reductase family protein [Bacteroidales bacterium]|nr:flavin reductase family protein [Bacteroidales bacterium]
MKKQLKSKDILFPVPAALVVCGNEKKYNILTIGWIGMVSSTPPSLVISIQKNRYSLELIRETKEFTVNIPSSEQYLETDYCGVASGRDTDKFADTGFTQLKSLKIKTPIIKECPFNLECKLTQEIPLGEHIMLLAEAVEAHIDEDKMDPENRVNIDIGKVNPLVYCATVREYWTIGKKLGKSFESYKKFVPKKAK